MSEIESYFKNIKIKNFEIRDVQISMTKEIYSAFQKSEHRIIEAETGVGKTLAYLLPLVITLSNTNKKGIVITYSKALQDQILYKDLPFLKKILGKKFDLKYVSIMGSNNYLCPYRLERFQGELFSDFDDSQLTEWADETTDGLLSEMQFPASIIPQINRDPDNCLRKQCPYYYDCFYYKAKNEARKANLIVTNHSLFFANVKSDFNIFPKGEFLIIDEAHQVEDTASAYLSVELSLSKTIQFLEGIYKSKYSFFKTFGIKNKKIVSLIHQLVNALTHFYNFIVMNYKVEDRLRLKEAIKKTDLSFLELFQEIVRDLSKISISDSDDFDVLKENLLTKLNNLHSDFTLFINHSQKNDIYYINRTPKDVSFHVVPLQIAEIFENNILEQYKSVIFTSATLTVKDEFNYFKSLISYSSDIKSIQYHSIFDYQKQTVLYIPETNFEHVNDQKMGEEILDLVNVSQGASFVLFTNYRQMNQIYKNIKSKIAYPILLQKGGNSSYILKKFKQQKNSVLFGNITFWQGVDMPGTHLRNVIVTHLPFKVPSDPIIEARGEYYEKLTKNSFVNYYLPLTAIILKQGLGRLIRTKDDFGIVSILDTRIRTKYYGKILLKSLPDMPITNKKQDLKMFFKKFESSNT